MAIFEKHEKRNDTTFLWIRFWCEGGCGTHEGRGRHAEKAGTTHLQAKKRLRERLGEVAHGSYRDPRSIVAPVAGPPFDDLCDRFLRDYASTRRSDFFEYRIRRLRRVFAGRRLSAITPADLDAHLAARGHEVSASSVRHEATVLGVMFRQAVRWGMVDRSPALDMNRPAPISYATRYLTPDEFAALEREAPPWLRPCLRLAVMTGLRLKEITNLRWEDYDRKAGVLTIIADRKVPTVHHVPVSGAARLFLERLPRRLADPHILTIARSDKPTMLDGRRTITAATRAAAHAAGLPDISFRNLRHTAASWMIQAGVPIYEVQRVLGHSTPLMTQRYAALTPGNLANAVEAIGRALPPPAESSGAGPR